MIVEVTFYAPMANAVMAYFKFFTYNYMAFFVVKEKTISWQDKQDFKNRVKYISF